MAKRDTVMTDRCRQLAVAFLIYSGFMLLMSAAGIVNHIGERGGLLETTEPIAGLLSVRSRHKVG